MSYISSPIDVIVSQVSQHHIFFIPHIQYTLSTASEFFSDQFTVISGSILTLAAVIGVFYKGLKWLRDEVKKENRQTKEEVKIENEKIKKEAIERIEQNREDINMISTNISKELTANTNLLQTKLDNIQTISNANRAQLEGYTKDIAKTVSRNHDKINNHETRLAVVETKMQKVHDFANRLSSRNKQNKNYYEYDNENEDEDGENQ